MAHQQQIEVVECSGDPQVAEVIVGRVDGRPDRMIEFVDGLDPRFSRQDKWVINVSTQFGCPIRCLFCDAGGGYGGDLDAALMLEQVERVLDRQDTDLRHRCRKLKVHFSRMGEPALNAAVLETLEQLPSLIPTPGLWACVATTLPRGSEPWFEGLIERKQRLFPGRFQLQFSVNSTDPDWRGRLMPYPHLPLEEMAEIAHDFWQPGDRKIGLNFALAKGIPVEAELLRRHFDPRACLVKLTPLNPTSRGGEAGLESAMDPQRPGECDVLVNQLMERGFEVVVSIGDEREDRIGSNCGQAVRRLQRGS